MKLEKLTRTNETGDWQGDIEFHVDGSPGAMAVYAGKYMTYRMFDLCGSMDFNKAIKPTDDFAVCWYPNLGSAPRHFPPSEIFKAQP